MATVANQPVGPDAISGHITAGTKLSAKNHPGFLGSGIGPGVYKQVSAGTDGGPTKAAGQGLPQVSSAPLPGLGKPSKES